MAGLFPTTGVWWDLNTCPVPVDFDPRLVRGSIESALNRFIGRRRITVFAVGNLDDISTGLLEKISSSGILLRHTPLGGLEVYELVRDEWMIKNCLPRGAIMLISRDPTWFLDSFTSLGYTVLRAYDGSPPTFAHCPSLKVWGWENLLKEYSHCEITSDVDTSLPPCLCFLCKIHSQSFDGFINHLKSREHIQELFDTVPSYEHENYRCVYFCKLCNYPAYNSYLLDIYYNSEAHAQKLLKQEPSDHEKEKEKEKEKEAPLVDVGLIVKKEDLLEQGQEEEFGVN